MNHYSIISGRFQPFHLGHLAFIEHVGEEFKRPIILGIINPDPAHPYPGDSKGWFKSAPEFNPLNFWERSQLIRTALKASPVERFVVGIVPIARPSINLKRAESFLPPHPRTFFLCQKWNDEAEKWKRETYQKNGEQVEIVDQMGLPSHAIGIEGQLIRALISTNDERWKMLVPSSNHAILSDIDFEQRVRKTYERETGIRFLKYLQKHKGLPDALKNPEQDKLDGPIVQVEDEITLQPNVLSNPLRNDGEDVTFIIEKASLKQLRKISEELFVSGKSSSRPIFKDMTEDTIQIEMSIQTWEALNFYLSNK